MSELDGVKSELSVVAHDIEVTSATLGLASEGLSARVLVKVIS
jgi:hypothetical protein